MLKVIRNILVALMIALMIVATLIYVAPRFNYQVDTVISSSMAPAIDAGSAVFIRPVNPANINVGDIITFAPVSYGKYTITHRVIGIEYSTGITFSTKGDANAVPDPFRIGAGELVGKVVFHAPYIGFFIKYLHTATGFIASVIVPGTILIIAYLIAILREIQRYSASVKKAVVNEY